MNVRRPILAAGAARVQGAVLDSRRMEGLKLRFVGHDHPELTLGVGVHGVGRAADGRDALELADGEHAAPAVRFCVDRRGVWLTVAEGARGVHVNGREIRRMAMLRVGDAVYVDGKEMRLVAATPPRSPEAAWRESGDESGDPRVVLRGVGGQYHGRSFTLEAPRLVGRAGDADIRIDDPAFADRHARLELIGGQIVLRDLGSVDGTLVNGETMRDALLQPGDQIVFDAHHRFVIEAPSRPPPDRDEAALAADADSFDFKTVDRAAARRARPLRLPWLLLAALLIAGLLALLLLFGSG